MKLSLALLAVSLIGMVGGAALIGWWAVGLALIFWSGAVAIFALTRDVPDAPKGQPTVTSLEDMFERARRSS